MFPDIFLHVSTIRNLLSQNKEMRSHFRHELQFLKKRENIWREQRFRIGLLGITSSGKSTLVNALLQEKLLPEAVRPSSNSLVICKWGQRLEGRVYFRNAKRISATFKGKHIHERLSRYADEATNPNNRYKVEEIIIKSPHFMLGQDVSIIDTPGLDAYGYDDHEKLAIEVLLPTVDAVIFVTTCKANSDEKIKDYVCLAKEYDKPVIVVQNMIDSIVEKIGCHGQILETKGQVAKKHLRRLQKVFKRANVEAVSLTQVSALWALNGHIKKSGLKVLVDTIRSSLNRLTPIAIKGRFRQLARWLDEIIDAERMADDQEVLLRYEQELMNLNEKKRQTEKGYDDLIHSLQETQRQANVSGKVFCSETMKLSKKSVREAYDIKNRMKKWLEQSPKELSCLNKKILAQLDEDCRWLNLRREDMVITVPKWRTDISIDFSTTEKSVSYLVEQSGFWGQFKRSIDFFNSEWGYDKKSKEWTEIENLSVFKRMVETAVKNELSQVDGVVADSIKRVKALKSQVLPELDLKLQSLGEKISSIADVNARLKIAEELGKIRSDIKYEFDPVVPIEPNIAKFDERFSRMELPVAVITMVRLAKLISRRRFLKVRDDVLSSINKSQIEDPNRILIAGFDQDCINDFINRFWFDKLEIESEHMARFQSIKIGNQSISSIAVAYFTGSADPMEQVRQFMSVPTSLFLLVDIHQIGASENMLMRAGIPLNGDNCVPVIVVQSVKELWQAEMLAEGLNELKQLIRRIQCKPADIIVNDENILFTELARLMLIQTDNFRTVVNETEFIYSLPPGKRNLANETIRSWKVLMTPE